MSFSKIEGHSHFLRDNSNNSIINTDNEKYINYIKTTNIKKEESNRLNLMENDLGNIKEEINQIKNLLIKLLEK